MTVRLPPERPSSTSTIPAVLVSPVEAARKTYWGYETRLASSLSNVFNECPYSTGYDYVVGTSERGEPVTDKNFNLPPFK